MIRVFPRKTKWTPTDRFAFVGDPPLFRPPEQPVRISVCFTWDIPEGQRLREAWGEYYGDVQIGGPAFDDPGGEFTPGRFIKKGVTITSRGCPNYCPWCYVPGREGGIRELPINPGWIIQDNNLLACSQNHIQNVFDMLRGQKKSAIFSGGFNHKLFNSWHRELLDTVRLDEVWFAFDSPVSLAEIKILTDKLNGIPVYKRRCYAMIGYNGENLIDAERRLKRIFEAGFYPFAQLFRGDGEREYTREWLNLARKWSRPAFYKSVQSEEFPEKEGKT